METRKEYRDQERATKDECFGCRNYGPDACPVHQQTEDRIWTGPTKKCQGCNALLYVSDPDLCERCDEHESDALGVVGLAAAILRSNQRRTR